VNAAAAHRRRWLILPVLCISVFLVVVDNTIVNVALPELSRDLRASTTGLQWIVDAYSLAFAGLLLAGGGIGDRVGRKGTMQVGLLAFGAFSTLAAASHSTGSLIGARALMGVAAAFVFPASLAILTSVFPDPSERQTALGIWGATSGLAVAFGPITGGALLEHFWYGSVFLINLPIVAVAVVAGQLLIPKIDHERPGRFDLAGMVVSTLGVTALVLAIIEGPQWGWSAAGTLSCFALAGVVLAGFVVLELRRASPLLDVRVFRVPRFSAGAGSVAVAFFTLFGFIFLITQYLQFIKGYSTLSAGVHTLPFAIVAAVATPLGALAALRIGSRWVVAAGLASMGAGLLVVAFNCQPTTAYWGPIVISMVLLSLGLSLVNAPATEAVMGSLAADQIGAGAAVNNTTRELGGTLGVAIFGSVFASAYAPKLLAAYGTVPVPSTAREAATHSVAAALEVAARAPAPLQEGFARAATSAFSSGLRLSCLVGVLVTLLGALAAARFLPGRGQDEAQSVGALLAFEA
jgi:EmrB/QacA subfamily drug resistance transporter